MSYKVFLFSSVADAPGIATDREDVELFVGEFSQAKRLSNYDLVILNYEEFGSTSPRRLDFDKQCIEALERGTTVCFVHFDENVPTKQVSTGATVFNKNQVAACLETQPGFFWLMRANGKIRPIRYRFAVIDAKSERREFFQYLKHWGVSHNGFLDVKSPGTIIASRHDSVVAFAYPYLRGTIAFIPFNRTSSDKRNEGAQSMIDALVTYISVSATTLPDWAKDTPFFQGEDILMAQREVLERDLRKNSEDQQPFLDAKWLLRAREAALEKAVPEFISQRLGITTERFEKYMEDFWILRHGKERSAICEVKSKERGFKKNFVFDICNHRESQGYDETFPAILFISFNLQETSWEKKEAPIPGNDVTVAVDNNVLVLRAEDLVRLWDGKRQNRLDQKEILKHFHESRGWLEVTKGHEIVLHGRLG